MPDIAAPSYGIQLLLQELGVVDGNTGWTSYCGQSMDSPDQTVSILDTGGPAPEVQVGINHPSVQLLVRGSKVDYNGCYAQCIAIRKAILAIPTPTTTWPELTSVVERTDVQSLGRDSQSRPQFSMNYQLIVTPADVDVGHRI